MKLMPGHMEARVSRVVVSFFFFENYVCESIFAYLKSFFRSLLDSGFCPRVPVLKNRYKSPNNVQQLNKGS